jgi:hypothetical protein
VFQELHFELARTLEGLLAAQWSGHRAPKGMPWLGNFGQSLTFQQKLQLRRSLHVELTPAGIRISLGSRTFGRRSDASVLQFGGLTVSGFAKRSRGAAKLRFQSTNRRLGGGLMTYRTPVGWRSTYSVRHQPNELLPEQGSIPQGWAEELETAAARVMSWWFRDSD